MPSEQPPTRVEKPRMALRPYHDDPERLDDVVVEDVAMFRAEMMDDGHLWMACYFDKSGTAPDLHFSVIAGKTGRAQLHLSATDVPPHIDIDAAPDEPAAPSEQPREGTRVNPDDVERAERWIGDAISRYYDHGCDDEADRDVMAMRRCIDALKARLEPAQPQPRGEGDDLAARGEARQLLLSTQGGYFVEIPRPLLARLIGAVTPPEDDLVARLEAEADEANERASEVARNHAAYGDSGPRHHARLAARAAAFREAAQIARDESSTEGGARPGDSPLNDTRTNSDRPWREDVARAFVTNRPAQPEGAGEARVKARKPDQDDLRMLRDMAEPDWATGLNPGQKAVIGRVLDALGVYEPAPSDTPTEEEGA